MRGLIRSVARNHNLINRTSQEPYMWPSVADAARTALAIRYRLLPYWYAHLDRASADGTPLVRALWWHWPDDATLFDVDQQVMVRSLALQGPCAGLIKAAGRPCATRHAGARRGRDDSIGSVGDGLSPTFVC